MSSGFFYVLVGLHSDNSGPACPDSEAWIKEDPTVAYQAYLEKRQLSSSPSVPIPVSSLDI